MIFQNLGESISFDGVKMSCLAIFLTKLYFRTCKRTIPDDEAKLLFALLDKDGSNQISKDEFMNFGKVMLVEFEKSDAYTTSVEAYFPSLYSSRGYQVCF